MIIKVAAVQMSSEIGNVKENVAKAEALTFCAIQEGANIICLTEMFNTGYFSHTTHTDVSYLNLAEPIDGFTVSTFRNIAVKHGVVIIVPFVEFYRPGVCYNSAAVIDADGVLLGTYRKVHIPWSHTGWEKFYFRPGYEVPVFDTKFGRIGIIICYDRDFPELSRTIGLKGAEIMFIPSGASVSLTETWKSLVLTRAYENQFYVLGSCLTGGTDAEHHEFMGASILADPYGKLVKVLGREEGILVGEVDFGKVSSSRQARFLYRDRRPEMYGVVSKMD
ncbi:MAG: carbon-nitrogen hydrolase family protein [Negativicutes bacterium]